MYKRQSSPEQALLEHIARLKAMGRFLYCMLKQSIDVEKDLKKGKLYFSIIRQYFPDEEDRKYMHDYLLTGKQWDDLRRLAEIVKTEKVESKFVDAAILDTKSINNQKLSEFEKQMTARIIKNVEPLQKILGLQKIEDKTTEMHLDRFGRCDIAIRADSELYVIEVKDETADHRVVGQIMKYISGGISIMKSSSYQWVNGVVIAPSYTSDAILNLKSLQVIPLVLALGKDSEYTLDHA
jgi:hypothetical protein